MHVSLMPWAPLLPELQDRISAWLVENRSDLDALSSQVPDLSLDMVQIVAPDDPMACQMEQRLVSRIWSMKVVVQDEFRPGEADVPDENVTIGSLEQVVSGRVRWLAAAVLHSATNRTADTVKALNRNVYNLHAADSGARPRNGFTVEIFMKNDRVIIRLVYNVLLALWGFWKYDQSQGREIAEKQKDAEHIWSLPDGPVQTSAPAAWRR